jgi:hypothetical protein
MVAGIETNGLSSILAEAVELKLGQVLYESQGRLAYVYFPITAIVSLLCVLENGGSAEIAVVGNEGMVGFALIMGGGTTPSRAVVQSAGSGVRMKAHFMKHEFNLVPPVMHLMLRFTQALITQMGTDGGLQSAPFVGSTTMQVAVAESGSPPGQEARHDAGTDCEHARRPAERCHRAATKLG